MDLACVHKWDWLTAHTTLRPQECSGLWLLTYQLVCCRVHSTVLAGKATSKTVQQAGGEDDMDLMRSKLWEEKLHQVEGHTLVFGG